MTIIRALALFVHNRSIESIVRRTYGFSDQEDKGTEGYLESKLDLIQRRGILYWYCDLDSGRAARFERLVEEYRAEQEAMAS
jgi:hypothetical protein